MTELLSPAGNFEKMQAAFLYGADAVYLAGKRFGMRASADNFTLDELDSALDYAHSRGKKIYLTLNTLPREDELPSLEDFVRELAKLGHGGLDGVIVADLGVLSICKKLLPDVNVHISTQAGAVNSRTCRAFYDMGASRVVLARELSLEEIKQIRYDIPKELEIEAFVHGSMCVSFSGRCLLSNNLIGRDANRGMCAQPCRWNYYITEEKRPEMPLPIEQTSDGTFIMSSKDMCMVEHVPELIEAGISSFKIEGRMKSAYYTAVVTNAYRSAIDGYMKDGNGYKFDTAWLDELDSVSHREYCTGYYFDSPMENAQLCTMPGYMREKAYIAIAESYDKESGRATFIQRNKVSENEDIELISPGKLGRSLKACDMQNEQGEKIDSAPHPMMKFSISVPFEVKPGDIIRGNGR
ncbi:MAG: U32 family peptidase [Clostridiales bacterium]|nr:U32 family peptidase [Clostridiales bacterium]